MTQFKTMDDVTQAFLTRLTTPRPSVESLQRNLREAELDARDALDELQRAERELHDARFTRDRKARDYQATLDHITQLRDALAERSAA